MTADTITSVPPAFYLIGLLLLIGPIVTLHELGHYLAGRLFGVHSEVFSFGFGKELIGYTDKRGTRWRISAIPLGGYVRFAGDANAASMPSRDAAATQDPRALTSKPLWQRAVVAAAGPAINLISAALIFAGFIYVYGLYVASPVVQFVTKDSAAERAGIKVGDIIQTVNDKKIIDFADLKPVIMLRNGQPTRIELKRGSEVITVTAIPDTAKETDRFGNVYHLGRLGIGNQPTKKDVVHYSAFGALGQGVKQVGDVIAMQVDGIKQIVTGRRPLTDLSGLPRMSKTAGEIMTLGWKEFLSFMAVISVAIGAINLLPIPSLDGGHLLLYGIEGITRRPLNQRLLEAAYVSGFFLIVCLMIFTFWNDLQAMGAWSKLASFIS
jgi:regulator of sigma E protease